MRLSVLFPYLRPIYWFAIVVIVFLAVTVTTLRLALPQLNYFQPQIQNWMSKKVGIEFKVTNIQGFWRNTHPSLSLQGLEAHIPQGDVSLTAQKVEVELDLLQSILEWQPVVADLNIHALQLDMTAIPLNADEISTENDDGSSKALKQLNKLLLRQLDEFAVLDSQISFIGLDGEQRDLNIEYLRWQNNDHSHQAAGQVSLSDINLNSFEVRANFIDHGSLSDLSGSFYVAADNLLVTPWLTKYLQTETGIDEGKISFKGWLDLEHNQPRGAYLELGSSLLRWKEGQQHQLAINSGILELKPLDTGWKVSSQGWDIETDNRKWPDIKFAIDWSQERWRANISQISVSSIRPIIKLFPGSNHLSLISEELAPSGMVKDIRVASDKNLNSLDYSGHLVDGSITQWELLPELHHLAANITGTKDHAFIKLALKQDTLPYGEIFRAPLNISNARVDLVWEKYQSGWRLWSNQIEVTTPDLAAIGAFRIDVPENESPFLSFYSEANLSDAGETWRYLPIQALGDGLTNYLTSAIRGGMVKNSKLLWYGKVDDFPYQNHQGIFQALVNLKQATFSFDEHWPPVSDLNLNLLFLNDSMYLDSEHATLMGVKAQRISGRIPEFSSDGHLEIEASATGLGDAVREYMMSSPLANSVGAALTEINIAGNVSANFQLRIPFDESQEVRAWGRANLDENDVAISTPPMSLKHVTGQINFDNDVISSAGLSAELMGQPISVDFNGKDKDAEYHVGLNVVGDWDAKPLIPYVGEHWIAPLEGHAQWSTDVDIQLKETGFNYQIDTKVDLKHVGSQYPYPLAKEMNTKGTARLQASGNQETISARVRVPNAKYQAEIDIRKTLPLLTSTNLVLGSGSFKVSPFSGHYAQIRLDHLDLDKWIDWLSPVVDAPDVSGMPKIPLPQKVDLDVAELSLAGIEWNDVAFNAKRKGQSWYMNIDSQEVKGEATYFEPYDISVALERLHIFVPSLESNNIKQEMFDNKSTITKEKEAFARNLHQMLPNITLKVDDFWFQGYKVGHAHLDLQRQGDKLEWKKLDFESGANKVDIKGWWQLNDDKNHTKFDVFLSGENNSDVMERFGISSGIQRAPFDISAKLEWDGAPWSAKVSSLNGEVGIKLGKGMISDVSGAASLLGIFSLDSIIRRMQLDFSDVFDQGMAFNSLTGSGSIREGIFLTNDIKMDAIAGEMKLKGLANLNNRTIDAEVNFIPDITSGIPVLTAFAVTPQTALYVLAITTVISPVVEVFTEVNYAVKGPIDNPEVSELSRSKGEFELPDNLRKSLQ